MRGLNVLPLRLQDVPHLLHIPPVPGGQQPFIVRTPPFGEHKPRGVISHKPGQRIRRQVRVALPQAQGVALIAQIHGQSNDAIRRPVELAAPAHDFRHGQGFAVRSGQCLAPLSLPFPGAFRESPEDWLHAFHQPAHAHFAAGLAIHNGAVYPFFTDAPPAFGPQVGKTVSLTQLPLYGRKHASKVRAHPILPFAPCRSFTSHGHGGQPAHVFHAGVSHFPYPRGLARLVAGKGLAPHVFQHLQRVRHIPQLFRCQIPV